MRRPSSAPGASSPELRGRCAAGSGGQVARGQIEKVKESEAKPRYGAHLAIASLGAIEKGTRDDGPTEIRIIHDGAHKVDVSRCICIRDKMSFPLAAEASRLLRRQAAARSPLFGLTADVKEAHRAMAVHIDDWPLQACQVEAGGSVYINKRGTCGVASAASAQRLGLRLVK